MKRFVLLFAGIGLLIAAAFVFGRPVAWTQAALIMWDIAASGERTLWQEVTPALQEHLVHWRDGEGDLYLPEGDVRAAMDLRHDGVGGKTFACCRRQRIPPREDAAKHTLLAPRDIRRELAIGGKACELRAGAGTARRAVVGAAGAQDEVAAVQAGARGRAKELDVVDLAPVIAGDVLPCQLPATFPAERGQGCQVVEREPLAVVVAEKEPVAAPGDVAGDASAAGKLQRHVRGGAIAGHVLDAHRAVGVEHGDDVADRRFDGVGAGSPSPPAAPLGRTARA